MSDNKKWLRTQAEKVRAEDYIDPSLYRKYGVKRGLRDDTGIGVLAALFVNAMLPGGFTFRFMRRFYAWLGIQSDLDHTGPEVPLINRKNKK